MSSVKYMDDGSVRVTGGYKKGVRFEFDTGAGLNNILWNELP